MEDIEIKILGINYKLKFVEIIDREEFKIGEIDYINQEILIIKDLGEDLKKETILHEVLHGILNHLGFDEESTNEHLIQSLATSLYQVLTENAIFKY